MHNEPKVILNSQTKVLLCMNKGHHSRQSCWHSSALNGQPGCQSDKLQSLMVKLGAAMVH